VLNASLSEELAGWLRGFSLSQSNRGMKWIFALRVLLLLVVLVMAMVLGPPIRGTRLENVLVLLIVFIAKRLYMPAFPPFDS
jgi:hypothetical protein